MPFRANDALPISYGNEAQIVTKLSSPSGGPLEGANSGILEFSPRELRILLMTCWL